ncbi:MAG: sulfatase-like hydrolase/transferase [Opitutae bacterium]|nr:sulfatase-like hydrolase/transferase [Opitutae bacterium]
MKSIFPLFCLFATAAGALFADERPNMVFLFADDWGRYASAYEKVEGPQSISALIDTPHFDRVANEGILFTNAFVPAPSCTPCRSSILSGRYFWNTERGAILQGAVWDPNIPTFPLELEKAGYHIGYSYKVWTPGTPPHAPYGAKRTAYHQGGTNFNNFSQYVSRKAPRLGIEGAKEELYDEVRVNFDAFIADREEGQPFCFWWGPTNTHRKWTKGSGQALWGLDPDKLKGWLPKFLPDVHDVREDLNDYLGECLAVDAGIGLILKKLEEMGELDNTLVVISGDHGIPGIPRGKCNLYDLGTEVTLAARWLGKIKPGRVVSDFINLRELAPTFLKAGQTPVPEGMAERDLMPLFLAEGSGRIDPARTFVILGRERHVAAAREEFLPYPQRAIRTEDFLYIRNFEPDRWPMGTPGVVLDNEFSELKALEENTFIGFGDLDGSPTKRWVIEHRKEPENRPFYDYAVAKRPEEELYDLRKDPDYLTNVADEKEYLEIKGKLSQELMDTLVAENDPRVVENPVRFERPPYTGPFNKNP